MPSINTPKNVLKEVKIKKYEGNQHDKIIGRMFFLDTSYLKAILSLQDIIITGLNDPEIFKRDSEEFLKMCITKGKILGIMVKNELVAYCIIYFPGHNRDNLGEDIGLQSNMLNKVAHFETVAVLPAYRGNSLSSQFYHTALEIISKLNHIHVCATVSPGNIYSLTNFLQWGFLIKGLKFKYDKKLRYIVHKEINVIGSFNPKETREIDSMDVEAQQKILQRSFYGYRLNRMENGFTVTFGK